MKKRFFCLILAITLFCVPLFSRASISFGFLGDINSSPLIASLGGYGKGSFLYPASASVYLGSGGGIEISGAPTSGNLNMEMFCYLATETLLTDNLSLKINIGPDVRIYNHGREDGAYVGFGGMLDVGLNFFLIPSKAVSVELGARNAFLAAAGNNSNDYFYDNVFIPYVGLVFNLPDNALLVPLVATDILMN